MNDFLVSVLIPCYNSSEFLHVSFNSIFSQTYKNIEIVCIDDCSSDDTYEKLLQYQKDHSFVRVYRNETNMGVSFNRNKLINLAKGKYFIFLDSDDFYKNNAIEKLVQNSNNGTKDIVTAKSWSVFNIRTKRKDKIIKLPFFPIATLVYRKNKYHFVKSNICLCWANLFNKEYWEKHNFQFLEKHNFEDLGLLPFVFLNAERVKFINTRLYFYYRRTNSISRFNSTNLNKKVYDMIAQWKYLVSMFYVKNSLNDAKVRKSVNGSLIVMVYAILVMRKHIIKNNGGKAQEINEDIFNTFEFYKIMLNYSKTWWKSIAFFYSSIVLLFQFAKSIQIRRQDFRKPKYLWKKKTKII